MRKALVFQWLAVLSIFVGLLGGCAYHPLFLLVPLGFIAAIVNSAIASFKLAKLADDEIKKLGK